MSLADTKAWAAREQGNASHARAIIPSINGDMPGSMSRIYLFNFPIYNKVARLDRERQLFNVTMADHILHEHRRNPWLFRSVVTILLLTVLVVLCRFPPPIVQDSLIYQNLSALCGKVKGEVGVIAEAARTQARIPEKVWIGGEFSIPKLRQDIRELWRGKINPEVWRATMARQMQDIQESNVGRTGLALEPADGVVLAVRGDVRLNRFGLLLQPKNVVRQGSTIVTGPRSFVKIWMPDGSTISVGPGSELKIPRVEGKGPVALELQSGSMRAKVTKSTVLGEDGKPAEKLIIKTASAALGIRGTDFYVSYSSENEGTTLVTFEGLVAFARKANSGETAQAALSGKSVVPVGAGTYSEVRRDQGMPSAVAPLSAPRLEQLKSSSDVSGPAEIDAQAQTLRYLDDLSRSGALMLPANSKSSQYESLSEEELDEIAAPVAPQRHISPRKDDYELVTAPPPGLAPDKREFPDQPER